MLGNHRIGALGWLTFGPNSIIPGNQGLRDQQLTMQWVRQNIKAFGGDPNRITIGGQSAGGLAGNWHMTIPSSNGLFDAVLAMSGPMIYPAASLTDAAKGAQLFISNLGCNGSDDITTLTCLRSKSVAEIVLAQGELCAPGYGWWTLPVVDGVFLPGQPANLLLKGKANLVPVLQGSTLNEFFFGGPPLETMSDYIRAVQGLGIGPQYLEKLLELYPADEYPDPRTQLSFIINDQVCCVTDSVCV